MTDHEIALRAAINMLNDALDTGRMPSGIKFDRAAFDLHGMAVAQLERMLAELEKAA